MSTTLSANAISIVSASAICDPTTTAPFVLTGAVCATDPSRTDLSAVNLGAADGNFFSLGVSATTGYGGYAIFELSPAFTGPAMVVEVTNPSNHLEAANVYVANSLSELNAKYLASDTVGTVDNGMGGNTTANNTVTFTGVYSYIMFEDVSSLMYSTTGSQDGFDLDSFTVTPVPLPLGALLLGTAILGLGASRRRT